MPSHNPLLSDRTVKVQDLDGATCTSLYWASSACVRRCPFERTSSEMEVLTDVDNVKGGGKWSLLVILEATQR